MNSKNIIFYTILTRETTLLCCNFNLNTNRYGTMTKRYSMKFVPIRLVDKVLGQQMVKVLYYYYYCYVIRIIFKLQHELNFIVVIRFS